MKNGYKIILVALLILVLYVGISQKTYFNRFEYVEADVIDVVGDNIWIGKDCEVVVGSISPERVEAIELGKEKELGPRPFIYDNFVDVLNFYDVTLEVTDNDQLKDSHTILLGAAGPCEEWPQPNGDLVMENFRITHYKRDDVTRTRMSGFLALPDVSLGDSVECRVTIELFDALLGGGDCVLSEEAMLNVKDGKWRLVISKQGMEINLKFCKLCS